MRADPAAESPAIRRAMVAAREMKAWVDAQLAGFAQQLYDRLGSPRADGFYASDQTGYPFSLAIDALANRLTARAVPGQLISRWHSTADPILD